MKKYLPHLLASAALFLLSVPAQAARVEDWRYDPNQNQLEFTTDQDVQPQAQLITDPTRLVIDLPGIVLGRPSYTQALNDGTIRSIRFGQFDRQTMRIVIELAPGYTLDPNQVKFRGTTARQWSVQIPAPIAANTPPAITPPVATQPPESPPPERPPTRPNLPPLLSRTATIDAISIDASQLVIRSNQTLQYSTNWESSGYYRITVKSAQLSQSFSPPPVTAGSIVQDLKIRQEGSDTVVIAVKPAIGTQIVGVNQVGRQQLALQIQRRNAPTLPPNTPSSPIGTIPVPTPPRPVTPTPVQPPVPNGKLVVVVDPGHGGPDPGAIGIGGIQEKEIVLDISKQVAAILEQAGVQAVMTRTSDIDLDLEPRVQLAQRVNAAIFVSIHANAIDRTRPEINGLETYYYESGLDLARSIHSSVLESLNIADRRVRSARFYVLRRTSMPAVLVETGFVTGRDDAPRLANPAFRSQMAAAIARGILQYLGRAARN